jgi:hypothetical protein
MHDEGGHEELFLSQCVKTILLNNICKDIMDAHGMVMSCVIFKRETFSLMILNNAHARWDVPLGCVYKRSQVSNPEGRGG